MKKFLIAAAVASLAYGAANASGPTDALPPQPTGANGPMVEWVIPVLPSTKPQTDEEANIGKTQGRPKPAPEVLQPMLDKALPAYEPRKDLKLTGQFKGAASDVLPSLVQMWIAKFKTYYPDVSIEIAPPYAGSLGAVELVKGNLQFVFVSRELKPDDLKDFKAKFGYDPTSVPISGGSYRHFGFLDSMAFLVHKDNPIEKLTFDQVDAIFSSTHHRGGKPAMTWGDLGATGEWADKPIHVYGINPWNGFEEFIRQKILSKDGKRGEWRKDMTFDKVVFPAARHMETDRYGIGYTGLAYIDSAVKVLPLGVTAAGPFYAPTYENVALAVYPLSRLIYFNTNKAPGKPLDPALEEFLRFILSREGQQMVIDHAMYVPLRAFQVETSRALLTH